MKWERLLIDGGLVGLGMILGTIILSFRADPATNSPQKDEAPAGPIAVYIVEPPDTPERRKEAADKWLQDLRGRTSLRGQLGR